MTTDFKLNTGSGLTNKLYIYGNGLISVGRPFSTVPTLTPGTTSPADANFFSLFYDTDPTFAPAAVDSYFTPTEDDIFFSVPGESFYGFNTFVALELTPDAGNPGAFTATWSYTMDSPPFQPGIPGDAYDQNGVATGYPISGYQFLNGDGDLTLGDGSSVSFNYTYTPSNAPEPSTWIELIAGMAGVGFLLRRRAMPTGAAA